MKAINRLSSAMVRTITKPGFHHDGGGLYLQVSPSGSKSWALRYTLRGNTRYMGLGSASIVSLAEARNAALDQKRIAHTGAHPIDVRRKQQRELAIAEDRFKTFEWCAVEHHASLAPSWKNPKHAAQWINTLRAYAFPRIGGLPVNEVTLDEVKAVLEPVWSVKPETASRVMQRIRSVLTWAAANNRYPGYDPSMWEQLREAMPQTKKRHKQVPMSACAHRAVGSLIAQLRKSTISDVVKFAFEFTVLCAVRSGEARGARKDEIDFERRLWTIPAERMKMAEAHTVPLSDRAIKVLEGAFKLAPDSELVFPNLRLNKPLSDQAFTKVVLRETLEVQYTAHGFRSSFRDWAAENTDFPNDVCEAALAHKLQNKTEGAYKRTKHLEKRRDLMQQWAAYISIA